MPEDGSPAPRARKRARASDAAATSVAAAVSAPVAAGVVAEEVPRKRGRPPRQRGESATEPSAADRTPRKRARQPPAAAPAGAKSLQPPTDQKGSAAAVAGAADATEEAPVRRPRRAAEEPLEECILGYIVGSEDPPRSGTTKYRQSREVATLLQVDPDIPVAKERRGDFVWVAAVQLPDNGGKKYTMNADAMTPVPKFAVLEDNTCDVCGACCTEVLYEFRAYLRHKPRKDAAGEEAPAPQRTLHRFVAYISKECGRGLLGVQSEASRLREQLYRVISGDGDQAVETLRELWRVASKAQQRVITDELRHFAGISLGEGDAAAELRSAEKAHGALHKHPDDAFRAASRALGGSVSSRDLAAVTVRRALEEDSEKLHGYLRKVSRALRNGEPLPSAPSPWARDDLRETLRQLVRAWPMEVKLLDTLAKAETFSPDETPMARLQFVYLQGCGNLHALADRQVEKPVAQQLRGEMAKPLQRSRAAYASATSSVVHHGHRKAEDKVITVPDGQISIESVQEALTNMTWPDCTTRGNVVPEGATLINAFPLGVVNNYATGLCCSRPTILRPNLTRLLTRFIGQSFPNFTYTTIQLNRDYSARLHVDGNNHGPSYIMAIGDYTGGELWIYDEKGDYELELKDTLRGYKHLRPGTKLKGRLENIRNRWFAFDGTVPHAAMPFRGSRMSIVYFSRNRWETIKPEVAATLEELDFKIPRVGLAGPGGDGAVLANPSARAAEDEAEERATAAADREDDEVDEVSSSDSSSSSDDEDGEPATATRQWASRFLSHLGLSKSDAASKEKAKSTAKLKRVSLTACHTGLGLPAMALRELVDSDRLRIRCISEPEEALRFVRANCGPEHVFGQASDVYAGEGHCEVLHRRVTLDDRSEDSSSDFDLFVGSHLAALPSDLSPTVAGASEPHGAQALCRYLAKRRPHAALLHLQGLADAPRSRWPDMLSRLLEGSAAKGAGDTEASFLGLRHMSDYGLELMELHCGDYGVPLADSLFFALLVRTDVGGQEAADLTAGLAKALAGLLPRVSASELLLDNGSSKLLEIVRKEWKPSGRSLSMECGESKAALLRLFVSETKELGLKSGETPYIDHMRQEGVEATRWFPHASVNQRTYLNLVFERARQAGLDMEALVVDMSRSLRDRPWRDDGLLPPSAATATPAPRYSFLRHRPLTGLEELRCAGLAATEADLKGVSDGLLARMAAVALPLPAIGATLCALLAAVDLEPAMPDGRAAELLAAAPRNPGDLSLAVLDAWAKEAARTAASAASGADAASQVGGRAAVFLNLVRNKGFTRNAEDVDAAGAAANTNAGSTKLLHSMLTKVAEDDESGAESEDDRPRNTSGGTAAAAAAGAAAGAPAVFEEPKEWSARLAQLQSAAGKTSLRAQGLGAAMRWIREAAEDAGAEHAKDIVDSGVAFVCETLATSRTLPPAVASQRVGALVALADAKMQAQGEKLREAVLTCKFSQELDARAERLDVETQTANSKPGERRKAYVRELRKVLPWPMRRGYLEHVLQAIQRGWDPTRFVQAEGFQLLESWLRDCPAKADDGWSAAAPVLDALLFWAQKLPAAESILPTILDVAEKLGSRLERERLKARAEASIIAAVVASLAALPSPAVPAPPLLASVAKRREGMPFSRLAATLSLFERANALTLSLQGEKASYSAAELRHLRTELEDSGSQLRMFGPPLAGAWLPLQDQEARLTKAFADDLERRAKAVDARHEAEQREAEAASGRRAEELATTLEAFAGSERLRSHPNEALEELISNIVELRALVKQGLTGGAGVGAVTLALRRAESAGKQHCLRPEALNRLRRWLREEGLSCSVELLEARGFLDRLLDEGADDGDAAQLKLSESLRSAALPEHPRKALENAYASKKLRPSLFTIRDEEVPAGWTRGFSSSVGLHYYKRKGSEDCQWIWPESNASKAVIDEPAKPESRVGFSQREGAPQYVEQNKLGSLHCALCGEDGDDHFDSSNHKRALRRWNSLADLVQTLRLDFQEDVRAALKDDCKADALWTALEVPGLSVAWFAELWRRISSTNAPEKIKRRFWHGVVRPRMPTGNATAAAVLVALRDILETARLPEILVPRKSNSAASTGAGSALNSAAVEHALDAARKLRAQLDAEGRMLHPDRAGCVELQGCIKALNSDFAACSGPGRAASEPRLAPAAEALEAGHAALRWHYEREIRARRAKEWLQRQELDDIIAPMQESAILGRLLDVARKPALAAGVLSELQLARLTAALADGRLSVEDLAPGALPSGWELKTSSSTGLQYYFRASTNTTQWEWPLPRENA